MIDNIIFLKEDWFWNILIGTVLLGAFFIWKEWKHYGTARFWIKTAIACVALISLALIALEPATVTDNKTRNVILLTKDYLKKRLDSLKKIDPKMGIVDYRANTPIFKKKGTPDTVFVLGQGVEDFDLWQLQDKTIAYLGDTLPSGIVKYHYGQQMKVGEQLEFKGWYEHPKKGHRLVLMGPGGIGLDSIDLKTLIAQPFQLNASLKAKGKYIFELVEKDTMGKQLSKDPIPVIVENEIPLKIALINGFPTFESKYLKNYLAAMGHEVVVRSQITKDRFKYEYFNTGERIIGNLSKSKLESYDLIIIDAKSLRDVNRSSRLALERSIKEEGLGVLIQVDASFFGSSGNLERFGFDRNQKTTVTLESFPKVKMEKHPYQFREEFGMEPLHRDKDAQIVSAYKRRGKGRIGTTILTNTYELILNGEAEQYRQLWSEIIERLGKKQDHQISWKTSSVHAIKDHPFDFELRTLLKDPEVKTGKGYDIALRNTIDVPTVWKGRSYPLKEGWHSLGFVQDSSRRFHYFVQDTSSWKARTAYDKVMANKRFLGKTTVGKEKNRSAKRVSPLVFFGVFLMCIGALWLLPKLLE